MRYEGSGGGLGGTGKGDLRDGWNTRAAHGVLGGHLVEAETAGRSLTARVGDTPSVQLRLDGPVLPIVAMDDRNHKVAGGVEPLG